MLFTYPDRDGKPSPREAVWIDLYDPTPEEIKTVSDELGIDIPSRDALEEIESSSRLQEEDGRIIVTQPVMAHGEDDMPTSIGFILAPAFIVGIRYTEMHAFDTVRKTLAKHKLSCSSAEIYAMIAEGMVDFAADTLEHTSADLAAVSRDVFRRYGSTRQHNISRSNRRMRETLVSVGGAGENLSQIRDAILGLQRVIPFVGEKGKEWIDDKIQARFKVVVQDLQSLSDFEVHLSNKVQFLLDAVLGFINTEQNDIFKVLTIASVVGIPPTFIASMYGMNFHNMPEYSWAWGYEWGLGLIFLSTVLPIIWFKWRGWW
ncbi:MAG TPA: magnesium transporter CorA family protein [Rhizomicrobium sp.]|jgi:magnesium transporter